MKSPRYDCKENTLLTALTAAEAADLQGGFGFGLGDVVDAVKKVVKVVTDPIIPCVPPRLPVPIPRPSPFPPILW